MTALGAPSRPGTGHPQPRLLIGGEWRTSAQTSPIVDPATEQTIGAVPHASAADLDDALDAVGRAARPWRELPAAERARIIRRAAGLVRERAEDIATVITRELGKPLREARAEVQNAIGILEWNAEEGRRAYGRVIPGPAGRHQQVLVEPVGPVAAFSPWNAPIQTPARKISSALAAGCPVVIKPAEETPGAAVCLATAFVDAGLPAGVLNVVFGDPARISSRLLAAEQIRAVTFTGSTAVGRSLAGLAAANLKRAVMELGGHAPVLVAEDVAPEAVAAGAARAAFRNSGQVCTSPTRFFVHERGYDAFVAALTSYAGALRVGDGLSEDTDIGPVASPRRLAEIESLVEDAVRHGARVTTGGRRRPGPGYFWEPTVVAGVTADCRLAQVEPFGPVATVTPVADMDEGLRLANGTPYALAGYVFAADAGAIRRLTAELDCGAIAVNNWQVSGPETPFGGRRDSGFGSEGGSEGLAAFQQLKFVGEQAQP